MRRPGCIALLSILVSTLAQAQLPIETLGHTESLSEPPQAHWVWASDPMLRRMALVDLDRGEMLGMINGGWGITSALFSRERPEIYVPETHYSRGSRGERTDVLTFYDTTSLAPTGEVVLPAKRAINALPSANAALSDDDRFVAVFNMTPATSLSIVDVEQRRFVEEIQTPGCSLAYAAGKRRFAMLCGNGAMLLVTLGPDGHALGKLRSDPFFQPREDPVTEKAVRWGDTWIFVSFEGLAHPVDLSGNEPRFEEPWPLLDDDDRADSWRVGGMQHLAVHGPRNRLYSLVHRGGSGTHKDPGTELWIYDLSTRQRVQRIELRSAGFTFMGVPLEFGQRWIWPFNRLHGWLIDTFAAGLGIGEIVVTRDDRPLLVTGANFSGSLAVYDGVSGEFLRRINTGNLATLALQAPWGGAFGGR
jgi:methylamine dehydrogenase heavy chain